MDLKERTALGDQAGEHWYYLSKAHMIVCHLPEAVKSILDIGAGVGWICSWLLSNDYIECATCVDIGYEDETEQSVDGRRLVYVKAVERIDAEVVLLMDVLEHVDDDTALLKKYWDMARPGTVFIVTVPAFQFLWSSHDEVLEHRRRYTCKSLDRTIRSVGASPLRLHYYYGAIFPIAVIVRMFRRSLRQTQSDLRRAPAPINSLLQVVCRLEAKIARWNRVAGLTVVAKFEKL